MDSYPFVSKISEGNPYGDRAITDEMEREFNRICWKNGVGYTSENGTDLFVAADTGLTVKVMPGGCVINGAKGYEKTERKMTLSAANASLDRIDRIVARYDSSDAIRSIELYVKEGTPSTTPVAPDVVQASNYCELALGDVRVKKGATVITQADITDQRANESVCGFIAPAFPTKFNTDYLLGQLRDKMEQDLDTLQAAIDGTTAGKLQSEIDAANAGLTKTNKRMLIFQDKSLDLTKAVSDSTYSEQGYTYHVDLTLSGCTADYLPDVYLSAPSSVISDICQTGAGYIRFFVSTNTGAITIPVIRLTKGGE